MLGPVDDKLATHASAVLDRIDPFAGAMVQALWCDDPDGGCLLLVMHRLVTRRGVLVRANGWSCCCLGSARKR